MTNLMADNPFATRDDAARALKDLSRPLSARFSAGCGRLRLGATGAHFHEAAADLEGLARPLWGLAPLAAGGGAFEDIGLYVEGLANGSDPDHVDYWGLASDRNQRIVESAAIGFALALAPETFWDGLPPKNRDTLAAWLLDTLDREPAPNNWRFFHVMVSLGLDRVGIDYDRGIIEADLDAMEALDIGNGWYRDGPVRRAEHYIPFAMHMYGLLYSALGQGRGPEDDARRERFRERARALAPQIRHWYASDGAGLPYGRSLTYRFAHAGFWGSLALADTEALPWGDIRGIWARNLRYWATTEMGDRDGVLSIGYGYPNLLMSEQYNSPGSPYWAFKAFVPLALGADHPFWTAEETPHHADGEIVTLREPGMVKWEEHGDVTVLTGGQESHTMRQGAEKYCKFAYSTRYGFSVENDPRSFENGPFDNMIAFSDDGAHYRVRSGESEARIGEDWLYSEWSPMSGVTVETWTIARPPWYLRVHRIVTGIEVMTREGGVSIERTDAAPRVSEVDGRQARVVTGTDLSILVDLGEVVREPRVLQAAPNTNLIFPRSWVPQLSATLAPGTHWLSSATMARKVSEGETGAAHPAPPAPPDQAELERLRATAEAVPVWNM